MKGKACSWRNMRRVNHVLKNADRLKGEMAALMACSGRTTRYDWDKAIEVMEACRISDTKHIQPSHATEIARHVPKETWGDWVGRCEKNRWTVSELRVNLLAAILESQSEAKAGELLGKLPRLRERKSGGKGIYATLSQMKIPIRAAYRWQKMVKVPYAKVIELETTLTEDGEELTSILIYRYAIGGGAHVRHNAGESEWYTPRAILESQSEAKAGEFSGLSYTGNMRVKLHAVPRID